MRCGLCGAAACGEILMWTPMVGKGCIVKLVSLILVWVSVRGIGFDDGYGDCGCPCGGSANGCGVSVSGYGHGHDGHGCHGFPGQLGGHGGLGCHGGLDYLGDENLGFGGGLGCLGCHGGRICYGGGGGREDSHRPHP